MNYIRAGKTQFKNYYKYNDKEKSLKMKSFKLVLIISLFLNFIISFISNASADDTPSPIVVELFTSQSCSSCPSADKVLGELKDIPNVIALGYHVTYWNHLDWKDTLSLESCTRLQNDFNTSIDSNRVYTPQMVINGAEEFIGSNKRKALSSIQNAQPIMPISLHQNADSIVAELPILKENSGSLSLILIGYDTIKTQNILDGENSGEVVAYTNPVRFIDYQDNWNKKSKTVMLKTTSNITGGYVVLIREGRAGKIIAAGRLIGKGLSTSHGK